MGLLGLLLCLVRLQSGSLQLSLTPRSLRCLTALVMCSWLLEFTSLTSSQGEGSLFSHPVDRGREGRDC